MLSVFLAGMIFDVIAIAGLTLIADALSDATGDALLLGHLRSRWHFRSRFGWPINLRCSCRPTYYVASTATGGYDLHGASKAVLRDWGARLTATWTAAVIAVVDAARSRRVHNG